MIRTRALTWLTAVAATSLTACGAAPPIGFERGTTWTIPMVAPLDNAEVIVPMTIHGQGPFLFVLAPDAEVSLIDRGVATGVGLYSSPNSWRQFLGADDKLEPRRPYEALRLQTGDLDIHNVVLWSAPAGSLRFRGQPIHGVLGADLLSRTIVVTIDRDRGVVNLALTGHETTPAEATRIAGRVQKRHGITEVGVAIRKVVVPARIGGDRKVELIVDLAARTSQLWPDLLGQSGALGLDGLVIDGVAFASYGDRRLREGDVDGVIGQDVLSRYRVMFDPDDRELWLGPRDNDVAAHAVDRLRRWGAAFTTCPVAGCVEAHVADTSDARQLVIARSASAPADTFEVVLQAVDDAGAPIAAPLIRATLNPGEAATAIIPADMGAVAAAANFRVIDASLHVPRCQRSQCVAALPR